MRDHVFLDGLLIVDGQSAAGALPSIGEASELEDLRPELWPPSKKGEALAVEQVGGRRAGEWRPKPFRLGELERRIKNHFRISRGQRSFVVLPIGSHARRQACRGGLPQTDYALFDLSGPKETCPPSFTISV